MINRILAVALVSTTAIGCQKSDEAPKIPLSQSSAAASTAGAPAGAQSGAAQNATLSGPVLETLSAPPYTYLSIKTSTGTVWAAVSDANVKKGDVVTLHNALLMTKFESKTLKRTFDEVYFGSLTPPGAAGAAGGAPPPIGTPPVVSANVGKIEKATGADAHTVGEVWAQKASLVGKSVTIRARVVKYNEGVMGKNWVHLQDGSGDAKLGTNDITVTTVDGTANGEIVTITGILRANKDFGAGYSYALIIEEAKIAKKL